MAGESSSDTLSLDYRLHHGNHRRLLHTISATEVRGARVDAIIVPAARPVESLNDAMNLARDLGCGVVALCSHDVTAAQAAAACRGKTPVIALDIRDVSYGLPAFQTAGLRSEFARPSNTSLKRNLGLVLAKVAGWERVLFLDDDIHGITASDARAAAALAAEFDVVGLENRGYPDNSVVCHTYRRLEQGSQKQFIGVGAMAVEARSNQSFFPNIYNQDWMFMLGCGFRPRLAVTGQMEQEPYDPFEDPDRARREEFGDCLAEGLYWLLDDGLSIETADIDHWRRFIKNRHYFIKHLIARATPVRREQDGNWNAIDHQDGWKESALTSLRVAERTSWYVEPAACLEFVQRWRADLGTWREFIAQLPADLGVAKALEYLGWSDVCQSEHAWPERRLKGEDRLIFPNGRECVADQQADRSSDRSGETSPLAQAAT